MAEIRVKGTGTIKLFENDNTSNVTIASPASLGADRTITLPDASVTLASGTMLATDGDGSSLTGLTPGITMADSWRISTSFTSASSDAFITANWEQADTTGFGGIGSPLTESSGVFTFPSTGIYYIAFQSNCTGSVSATPYNGIEIFTTLDNSSYNMASMTYDSSSAQYEYSDMNCSCIFDVTSTTLCKIKMGVENGSYTAVYNGNTSINRTSFCVFRLGDT